MKASSFWQEGENMKTLDEIMILLIDSMNVKACFYDTISFYEIGYFVYIICNTERKNLF